MSENEPGFSVQVEELLAAGWVRSLGFFWQAPNGALRIGPYGAWKEMRAAKEENREPTGTHQRRTIGGETR